jgi:hypothetical protein
MSENTTTPTDLSSNSNNNKHLEKQITRIRTFTEGKTIEEYTEEKKVNSNTPTQYYELQLQLQQAHPG